MNVYAYPPLISSILFAVLGVFVLTSNTKRSKSNYLFFFSYFTTFLWQFTWVFLFSTDSTETIPILIKIGYTGIIFVPITLFHFYVNYVNSRQDKLLLRTSYLLGVFFTICLWGTQLFINGNYLYAWGYYPKAGILHPAFLLLCSILAARALYLLWANLSEATSTSSLNQIRYLMVALAIYCFAAIDFLANWGAPLYPIGFIAILISLAITSYAIFRHHLLDINIIIKKTAVYSILTALLTGIFLSFILLSEFFFRGAVGHNSIWIAIFAAFFVSLIFQPLKNSLQKRIDRLFFKKNYDYQSTLKELSNNAVAIINSDILLENISTKISSTLKPSHVTFYLLANNDSVFRLKNTP